MRRGRVAFSPQSGSSETRHKSSSFEFFVPIRMRKVTLGSKKKKVVWIWRDLGIDGDQSIWSNIHSRG